MLSLLRLSSIHTTFRVSCVPGTALVVGIQQWTNKKSPPLPPPVEFTCLSVRTENEYGIEIGHIIISAMEKSEADLGVGVWEEELFYVRGSRGRLTDKVPVEHTPELAALQDSVPGSGQSTCKGPEAGTYMWVRGTERAKLEGWENGDRVQDKVILRALAFTGRAMGTTELAVSRGAT